ncbi:MAG: serine/threonine-protein kinase [Myxococcota bacterium]|nr:serine/threonine-protein kinase [Myxococcota bacterium]
MASQARASFKVGPYLCHTRLGVGGMAEVWLASRQGPASFEKQLVVKQLLPHLAAERAFSEMFLNEARLAARLNHPNIAQVFDLGEDPSGYFIVMEYVDGRSVRDVLRRMRDLARPLPQTVAAYIVGRACAALHHAHEQRDASGQLIGLVHRDVTPDNIIASFGGEVKVVDFGIAKATSMAPSHGTLIGKWPYMSPEQATGAPIDRRADVYSLAVVAYELLAGERPFTASDPVALTHQITKTDPRPLSELRPDIEPALADAIHAALRKDRDERTADARTFGAVMDHFARASHATADNLAALLAELFDRTPAPRQEDGSITADTSPLGMAKPRRRAMTLLVAACVVALAITGGVLLRKPAPAPPPVAAEAQPEAVPTALARPPYDVIVSEPTLEKSRHAVKGRTPRPRTVAVDKAPGSISVRVQPWADVLLDGKAVGTTPLQPISTSAGRHELTLVNAKLKQTKVLHVDVQPGKTVAVEVNLQR